MSTPESTNALESPGRGVQTVYTEEQVMSDLRILHKDNMSLREIAWLLYRDEVTHGDIQRALKGVFPKDPHKRIIMGLPALVPTPACPRCGEVHKIDGVCVAQSLVTITVVEMTAEEYAKVDKPVTITVRRHIRKDQRPRATINTANPESAAKTIRRKMDGKTLAALVELLRESEER